MSKMTNSLNQLWYQKDGDVFNMGLTRNFLESLDECWHILPTNTSRVKEKSPLFTIETNDSLLSILSPVAGNFLNWNDRATNFPDKLTEADVIIKLSTKELVKAEPPAGLDNEAEIHRLTAIVTNITLPMRERLAAQQLIQHISAAGIRPAINPTGAGQIIDNPFRLWDTIRPPQAPATRNTLAQRWHPPAQPTTIGDTPTTNQRGHDIVGRDDFEDNLN